MIILAIFFCILILIYFTSLRLEVSFISSGFDYYYRVDGYLFFHIFKEERSSKGKKIEKDKDSKINPLTRIFTRYLNNIKHPRNKKKMPKHVVIFKKISIEISIGLIEIIPTVLSIPIISTILSFIMGYNYTDIKDLKYNIIPVYNKLCLDLNIHSIVKIKLAHIIYIILMIYMEGVRKNGRSSNTRAHEHSYE
jgi:hypothetical protein